MDALHRVLMAREVLARRVSVRPFVGDFSSSWDGRSGAGVHVFSAAGLPTVEEQLPFTVTFAKERCGGDLVAAAGEGGCVQLFDTSKSPPEYPDIHGPGTAIDTWQAHSNSIFDIAWLQNDTHLLTGSGDQVIRLWNLEAQRCVQELRGHQGSIKSVCVQATQNNCLASGGRDGAIMLWDLRTAVRATRPSGRVYSRCDPVATIKNAHPSPLVAPRRRSSKDAAAGVTSVLYLKDGTIIASSGHADGVIKYWDTRKLHAPLVQTPQLTSAESPEAPARIHGIVCLAQDSTGGRLIASSRNNHIYMYDALNPERGPFHSFTGHQSQSFYTKATFSPDDSHILSGSTDNHVYIWEADRPQSGPFVLEGHVGEVTGVDWCKTDVTKVATCSDDCTVRVWTIKRSREGRDGRANAAAMRKRIYSARPNPAPAPASDLGPETPTSATSRARASKEAAADVAAACACVDVGGKDLPGAPGEREPGAVLEVENATGTSERLKPEAALKAENATGTSGRLEPEAVLEPEKATGTSGQLKEGGVGSGGEMDRGLSAGGSGRGENLGAESVDVYGGKKCELRLGGPIDNRALRPVQIYGSESKVEALQRKCTAQRAEATETEALQATPHKEGTRVLSAGGSLNPSRSPSTPVNVEGFEEGRLGLNPGPSPQFAFWNLGSRVRAPQETVVRSSDGTHASEPGLQSPCLRLDASNAKVSEKAVSPLRKEGPGRSVHRLPLSPTRVNVQVRGTPKRSPGIPLGELLDQQENVSPLGLKNAVTATVKDKDALESPSSVLMSPLESSRKRQRTIIDYFKNP
ncbi:hypothetical protein KFL_001100030 [Klebsormidium nitens]|uniref:Uncharacterized protein n=1 Tax=Klebsormidium nitens TaxID=105231 RepID=A0A1Y1HYW9_KLENI|nr:hypothetical protein KFL_001100030 [Klebsormidium nitens]|eukprot:GAQ82389.1 hypothetical protein KFL_001100030 [Klebsormidium nitens]